MAEIAEVSIPSSSGPGFGHWDWKHKLFAIRFQSPLHRGLGSDKQRLDVNRRAQSFQSPLHRGLGSDLTINLSKANAD